MDNEDRSGLTRVDQQSERGGSLVRIFLALAATLLLVGAGAVYMQYQKAEAERRMGPTIDDGAAREKTDD